MVPVEKRILIKAARMYYLEHMKQVEIAQRMGVDRTTISKYLKKALTNGIVKIEVENNSYEELETALERRFGLRESYVVPKSYDMLAVKQSMAQAGINLLRRILTNGQVIGMAWGSTIKELTRYAHREKMPLLDIDVVPIDGGPENIDSDQHVNTICYEMAKAIGGRSHYIYAPAITRTSEIRDAILQDVNYEKISNFWKRMSVAIVGIGAPVKSSNLVWAGSFGREAIDSMRRTGAVGEICSIFYDKDGRPVKTLFTDRTIAVPLEILQKLPYCIGMASSREKVPAIMGALRGHLINVLITDEETAKIILHE